METVLGSIRVWKATHILLRRVLDGEEAGVEAAPVYRLAWEGNGPLDDAAIVGGEMELEHISDLGCGVDGVEEGSICRTPYGDDFGVCHMYRGCNEG